LVKSKTAELFLMICDSACVEHFQTWVNWSLETVGI